MQEKEPPQPDFGESNSAKPFAPPWLRWLLASFVFFIIGVLLAGIGLGAVLGDPMPGTPKGNIKPFLALLAVSLVCLSVSGYCFLTGVIKAVQARKKRNR